MDICITSALTKYTGDSFVPETNTSCILYMAKNEGEGCQLLLKSETAQEVTVSLEGEGLAVSVFLAHMTQANGKMWPDPLVPCTGTVSLASLALTALYIRFTSMSVTEAGEYPYRLTVTTEAGEVYHRTITVHVWDFVLPETPLCQTAVGINREFIGKAHGTEAPDAIDALYRQYYELLLSHKISPYDIPCDLLDSQAEAYLNDPRMTSFVVPCCEGNDDKLVRIWKKISSHPMWLAKACFYPIDEPSTPEMLQLLEKRSERLRRLAPGIRICTPFYSDIILDDEDQIACMNGKTDLWCPQSPLFVSENFYTSFQWERYPSFPERMMAQKAAGDQLWWYVCWGPREPYCNLFIDQQTLQHRILFWQQYREQVDGFLYWSCNYWADTEDPWTDMATVKFLSPEVFGDGSLVYSGHRVGLDGVCTSVRLEALRDGVEDYDYLKLAETRFGREWVLEKIREVTSGLTEYTTDVSIFQKVRILLGQALETE